VDTQPFSGSWLSLSPIPIAVTGLPTFLCFGVTISAYHTGSNAKAISLAATVTSEVFGVSIVTSEVFGVSIVTIGLSRSELCRLLSPDSPKTKPTNTIAYGDSVPLTSETPISVGSSQGSNVENVREILFCSYDSVIEEKLKFMNHIASDYELYINPYSERVDRDDYALAMSNNLRNLGASLENTATRP
jgi:hypothetical protein